MTSKSMTPRGRIANRVHPLSEALDPGRFGGKACHFARVQRLGFRVPPTRALGRDALGLFLAADGLGSRVEGYLGTEDRSGLEPAFERIAAAVAQAAVPAELQEEILAAAAELLGRCTYGVAVRSSAVFEDSDRASFAGVFESFLGILDPDDVLRRVVACWTSLWSPRALRYMDRLGLEPALDGMAVMLQEVVPAVGSGVIYTADPNTGNPWRFGVSATPGLSLDLLSGSGVGDSFVVDWETGAVLEREVTAKPFVLHATPDGIARIAAEGAAAEVASTAPAVSDERLAELAQVGRELDEALDTRLDIEWALTPEGVTVLQARPLTALPTFFPIELTGEAAQRSWKPALATLPLRADRPPHRLTPLYRHESESEMWHRYQPKDIILTSICRHLLDVHGYRYWEADEQPTFQDYFDGPGEYEAWIADNEGRFRRRWDHREDELRTIRELAVEGLASTTTAGTLIPVLLEVTDRLWDLNAFGWSGPQALGWMCQAALDCFLKEHCIEADTPVLLGGEGDSYTFRAGLAQQEIGRSIREPAVVEALEGLTLDTVVLRLMETSPECDFLARLEAFCWRFGKSPSSWLGRPAFWSTGAADIQIVNAIKNAWSGKARDVEELHEASVKRRREQEGEVRVALAGVGAGEEVLARLDRLLDWARYWGQALNDRHGLTAGLLHERELVWQVGSRLRDEGLLERIEDVLVLERRDLEDIARTGVTAGSRETYRERLREERRTRRLTPPSALGEPSDPEGAQEAEPGEVSGVVEGGGASRGRGRGLQGRGYGGGAAVGRVRKIRSLDSGALDSLGGEDVLVLPHKTAFHYADWHSLLTVVRAVVSPGRPSHHLAQVARECGVPLVGHVVGDLDEIREGTEIRVDGSTGRVQPIG